MMPDSKGHLELLEVRVPLKRAAFFSLGGYTSRSEESAIL